MKTTQKVILITGASAGMGKDFAKELLHDGHIVYGAARRTDKMEDISQLGVKVLALDVTNDASMVSAIDKIVKAEGRIDVLINNAGYGSYGAVEDVPMSDARQQIEVNVFGAARMAQLVIPHMRAQNFGRIINVTSIGGKLATPLGGWYHASKFALEGLSDSLRNEIAQFGIDVVVIEPGGVKSEWGDIAADNLRKVSGGGVYKGMVDLSAQITAKTKKNEADPGVITALVRKAIEAKKPKTRYHGGYMASLLLFLKQWLPDRTFDTVMMSQLK
ncbi:SDR family NAD(P)-dependent oxidoreductase [Mucilaginibacter sp. ZT4R22]|uniref:SDR family NAD(P)-dependent oxidoreductase n=1 Tax=Mucilaginibacter pankratovii TaxID=2772110 RepID=A0ABR7WPX5_9SPHI|nr:oxidoreductase [Mucilaginibacter pankratovii]MBD1364218.1 SDR family NAD(P)-dependent oxidoreductase [Mucilaginibacter pankratovii]